MAMSLKIIQKHSKLQRLRLKNIENWSFKKVKYY